METTFQAVAELEPLTGLYRWIMRVAAAFLIGLAILICGFPERAERFLSGYASTFSMNTLEALLRFLCGISLVGFSWQVRLPNLVAYGGSFLAVSAIAMLLLPNLHKRFAGWAVPFIMKILPVYAAGSFLLGIVILGTTFLAADTSPGDP